MDTNTQAPTDEHTGSHKTVTPLVTQTHTHTNTTHRMHIHLGRQTSTGLWKHTQDHVGLGVMTETGSHKASYHNTERDRDRKYSDPCKADRHTEL